MTVTLRTRLQSVREVLNKATTLLNSSSTNSIPDKVQSRIRVCIETDIEHWCSMIDARQVALQQLEKLERKGNQNDLFPFGSGYIEFKHARPLGTQAYLSMNWSLADQISAMVGKTLCIPNTGLNLSSPAKLTTHFLKEETNGTTSVIGNSIRECFGWPVGIFYAIRNHFLHDGASNKGVDFFEGSASESGFQISDKGWEFIKDKAMKDYGVESSCTRNGKATALLNTPQIDLREVLSECEHETDNALGVILGVACNAIGAHVAFLTGQV